MKSNTPDITQEDIISALGGLGTFFDQYIQSDAGSYTAAQQMLSLTLDRAEQSNSWFTRAYSEDALRAWAQLLTEENLKFWLENYSVSTNPKTVAIIMAGNIPLVGFHDLICVLAAGHRALVKLSSNDQHLIPFVVSLLKEKHPELAERITLLKDEKLQGYDAVIATGSGNTARYFEYYFGKYPNIIRRNRNSVAVIDGSESKEELDGLAHDIMQYFGLGCRSVSKIFIPKDYDLNKVFGALYPYASVLEHTKYKNNYDYNKTVFIMQKDHSLLENGFMVMKQDSSYASPIGSLFYERYENLEQLGQRLSGDKEQIQCVVSRQLGGEQNVPFGKAQQPQLWDYADGVDTMRFLNSL